MATKTPKPNEAALTRFQKTWDKRHGEGTLERTSVIVPYETISTGSLILDIETGVGGLVEGRIHESWGVDAIGKTTSAILTAVEAQKKHPEKMVGVIDMEHTFDRSWAAQLGLDLDRLYTYTPTTAEDVSEALRDMVREGDLFSYVTLDSVGAMISKREMEKMSDEEVVGTQAKITTRMVKQNAVYAAESGVCVQLINQVRANIGYGSPITTGGGWALKHGTTMKFQYKRTGTTPYSAKVGGTDRIVGHEVAVFIERNKVAPSKRTAIYGMFFVASDKFGPIGVDRPGEAARIAVETGLVKRAGAWYTYVAIDEKFQGMEGLVEFLRGHPEAVSDIREAALARQAGQVIEDDISKGEMPSDDGDEDDEFATSGAEAPE